MGSALEYLVVPYQDRLPQDLDVDVDELVVVGPVVDMPGCAMCSVKETYSHI
jgi:hypothetical protein